MYMENKNLYMDANSRIAIRRCGCIFNASARLLWCRRFCALFFSAAVLRTCATYCGDVVSGGTGLRVRAIFCGAAVSGGAAAQARSLTGPTGRRLPARSTICRRPYDTAPSVRPTCRFSSAYDRAFSAWRAGCRSALLLYITVVSP